MCSSEFTKNLWDKLEKLHIPYLKLSNIIENDLFLPKLLLIFQNEELTTKLYEKIMQNFEFCKSKFLELDEINNYLTIFEEKQNREILTQITCIIQELKEEIIINIINEYKTKQIKDYKNLLEKSKNLRFKNSIIFMILYDELKNHESCTGSILFEKTKSKYFDTVEKIINFKNVNFMQIENIKTILEILEKKEEVEIDRELKFIFRELKLGENIELFNDVKRNLMNFLKLKYIIQLLDGYLFLFYIFKKISENNYQETEFTAYLKQKKEELSQPNIQGWNIENSLYITKNGNSFNEFVIKMYGKEKEIEFCQGKTDIEIKNLNEFLQDRQSENGNLEPEDFDDFIGCKNFVNKILQQNFTNDQELYNIFSLEFKRNEPILIKKFSNYFEKYGEIKELYDDSLTNKTEITKTKIQNIMRNSQIIIKKIGNNFIFKGKYKNSKNEDILFDLELLLELKNKTLFSQNIIKEDKEYNYQINKFNKISSKIKKLCETVNNLIVSGFPQDFHISLIIQSGQNNQEIQEIIKKYDDLLKKYKKQTKDSYINKPNIRFLYGPLILKIIEKIKSNKDISFLLKAISNGKIIKVPKYLNDNINDNSNFSGIFSVINEYLEECFLINSINLKRIFELNIIKINKKNTIYSGLYRLPIYDDLEKDLLILYHKFTGNFPLSNTVLICNEYTTKEQIKAFLYLSFKCDYPILFSLLNIEKLDLEERARTFKLINNFYSLFGKDMRACLVIFYNKESDVKSPLSNIIPENRLLTLVEDDKRDFNFRSDNIEIITSERSGFGKTEEIKNKVINESKKYIYFPLGGEFTLNDIIRRLIDLNIPQKDLGKYVIHFDLYETNLNKLVQEILLKMLILKKLDINERIFYFGDELKIIIELQNGFYNYLDKFPILRLFNNRIIEKLPPIKLPKNSQNIKGNPIQIVSMTLKYFEDGSIGKENINYNSSLRREECQNLIDKYIKNSINQYNYYQKMTFIKLLSFEFDKFNTNYMLDPSTFEQNNQKQLIVKCRLQVIQSLLESSIYFIKGPYDKLIESQKLSQQKIDYFDEEKLNEQAIRSLENTKENITFDSIPATLFFFNGDGTFTAITKQKKGTNEYNKFLELINTQSLYGNQKFEFPDYSKGDHFFYLNELKKILGLPEMLFDEKEIDDLNNKIREETGEELDPLIYNSEDKNEDRKLYMAKLAKKNGNYIYTRDNFIKSVIILLKIQASIPVILMGETGCGKTSLIKMLSIFMNKGYEKMKTLNIHAGTNEEDIIKFMEEKVIKCLEPDFQKELDEIMNKFDKENDEYKKNFNRDQYLESQKLKLKEKKTWIFFDELNTCNSMGLITEIMCKRTMNGKELPDNLIFLGACNPYRTMTTKMKQSGLTYYTDNKDKSNLLVYTVNPLPHTLMNFIFNFSSLNEEEEKIYIKSMIQQNISKFYKSKENKEYLELLEIMLKSICECHKYIRENYDASSVSLREIRRFNIFFNFFCYYLEKHSKSKELYSTTYKKLYAALNITIYLCYYLRISDKKIREKLIEKLNTKELFNNKFLDIPDKEVSYISKEFQIDLDKGIALNKSLKENLFASFVCIVNKIPLIIIGKPGESKSLAIQTINQTLKGSYSKSELFKNFPQLFIYNYQGSETSTSQGIIETFDKARAYVKNKQKNKKENYISMFFFDEMGLAERSPNNPLKAIHSQLEYDDNEYKIAFIGISNWKIDASKMNRCIILSKPDPDEEDLISTANIIAETMNNTLTVDYKILIESLAKVYYKYKEKINGDKLKENFHGNRDFYYLIKCTMRELIKVKDEINDLNKDKILTKIGIISLTRNFGGLSDSLSIIKELFKLNYPNYNDEEIFKYNIIECIKDNLYDYNSRYLMLVTNSTIMKYLEHVLDSQNKSYIFLTGSKFLKDKKAAEKGGGYSEDLLNKIQIHMSSDCVLILKNLELIYPSLYELFNQNYKKIGDKYFSRIAFANSRLSSEVNSQFRVVLLITQDQLNKMKVDPPLLNRFEKQIITFKESLTESQLQIAQKILKILNTIKTFNNKENNLVYNLPDLMINCNDDEIEGLIYKLSSNKQNLIKQDNEDDLKKYQEHIENEIFNIIVPIFCQDIILSVKYSGFAEGEYAEIAKKILDIYRKKEIHNFQEFLGKIKKDKNIIYTFSSISEIIVFDKFETKYMEVYISKITSENIIQEKLTKFYFEDKDYLIFRFLEEDLNKISIISYLINNFEIKYKQESISEDITNKKIIFLVHLSRKSTIKNKNLTIINNLSERDELISNLDDSYDKYFIDNLRSKRNDFINILNIQNSSELIRTIINDFDTFLNNNLNLIISYFDYNFTNKFDNIKLNEYTEQILNKLVLEKEDKNVQFLRNIIWETAVKIMNQNNIIPNVYTSNVFQNSDVDFFEVLETYIKSELRKKILIIINSIEKKGFFSCLLLNKNRKEIMENELIQKQIKETFDTIEQNPLNMPREEPRHNKINITTGLSIPSSNVWFKNIKINFIIKENIENKYINNENILRPRQEIKDEKEAIDNYMNAYKLILDGMKGELYKNENIKDIMNSHYKNIKKALFNDCLNIYCIELSEKFSNKNNDYKNPIDFINLLLQLKFNVMNEENIENYQEKNIDLIDSYFDTKEDFSIRILSEAFLFLECYKKEITFITEVYCLLCSYLPKTFDIIIKIINSKIIKTEKSKRNPPYKKRVNEVFYILIESLLKSIYINKEDVFGLKISQFYPFFDSLKFIEATLNKINQKLLLFSNELYSLRNLISIYSFFKNEKDVFQVIKRVMSIIEKDNEDLQNNNFDNLKKNINEILKIIGDRFGKNSDIIVDYMSNLLRQQYRKVEDQKYKYELLKLAFINEKLIQKSLYFIEQTIKIPFPILARQNESKRFQNKNSFCTKEECEAYFLSFISQRKNDKILIFYENLKSDSFNQVLLYYFELIIYNSFEDIVNKYKNKRPNSQNQNIKTEEECNELILNQNLLYLNKALIHIDNVFSKKNIGNGNLNKIGQIYAIAYVKIYIKYFAQIYKYNKSYISFKPITEIISSTDCNTRKVVKIFFFKNFLQYFDNYSLFYDYIMKDKEFPFRKDYLNMNKNDESQNSFILLDHLVNIDYNENDYIKFLISFNTFKHNKFVNINTLINKEFINNYNLDLFFCICVNHLLSYHYSNESEENNKVIILLKNEFSQISNKLGISQISSNLFIKLFDFKNFIQNLNQNEFEVLMYSMRFIIQSTFFPQDNFYYNLLIQSCKKYIDNNYIVGNLPFNNVVLKSYYTLNYLMNIPQNKGNGYYICTCGQCYILQDCTCPSSITRCLNPNCKLNIGGTGHKLLGKENGQTDHYRILLKKEDISMNNYVEKAINDKRIPYLLLEDYKKKYVDKYINNQPKGIQKEDIEDYIERNNNVRTLDEISFRILNFILYSHLLFSNILGNLKDNDLKLYINDKLNAWNIIIKDWEIIEEILNEKGIQNIKSFMNIIFFKIINLMRQIKDTSTIEKRENFETNAKIFINELISNKTEYEKYENKYKTYNERIKGSNPQSLFEILLEDYSPFENIYNKNDYPNLEFFLLSEYPDINELEKSLMKQPNYSKKYCLLNQILVNNEENRLIDNILNINKLVDILYKKFNNKIEREQAKEKHILECFEQNEREEIINNVLKPYINSWEKIKSKCTRYLCRPNMPVLNLTTSHTLNYFLPDDGELGGGMYLASAYSNIINWQNSFIEIIKDSIGPDSILAPFLYQLSQEIYAHEANEENIVKIDNNIIKKVKNMILQYSMRDIFKNEKIDYREFKKSIKFDFISIESELSRQILPGIKKFICKDDKEPIRFITYLYESFRSNRSSIIINYNTKYPPRKLIDEEEDLLLSFIKEIKTSNENISKDILSSCQILIDYIQKGNFNKNEQINSIIMKMPKYIVINDKLKSFFIENSNDIDIRKSIYFEESQIFSVDSLMEIYNKIEFNCWEQFKNNLNEQYKMNIPDNIKRQIKEFMDLYLEKNKNIILKKEDIAPGIRRLISRYLSGKRGDNDINEHRKLFDFIQREDLWDIQFQNNDYFQKALYDIFSGIEKEMNLFVECNENDNICEICEIKKKNGENNPCIQCIKCNCGLRVGHALSFYELISEESAELNKMQMTMDIKESFNKTITEIKEENLIENNIDDEDEREEDEEDEIDEI